MQGVTTVKNLITKYELVSNQLVNLEKSLIYFGANVDQNVRDFMTNILEVCVATNLQNYLGLSIMVGRRKRWAFVDYIDYFRKRIVGWSIRYAYGQEKGFPKVCSTSYPCLCNAILFFA